MKRSFSGYYRPTEEEFSELWSTCLFVLDANVLLNLYRYTPQTSGEFLDILKQIADRLWIPHQVGLEYQRRRFDVIAQQTDAYTEVKKWLDETCTGLENKLNAFQKHPFIDPKRVIDSIRKAFSEIKQGLHECEEEHPDFLDRDTLRDTLTLLFDGKVGPPYSQEKLNEIYREGKERYDSKIPPGFMDVGSKTDKREYGDLILWYQIVDKAREEKQPIILVTDDRKEDWWWKHKGRTFGPRPELVQEVLSKAEVAFYMYSPERFMEYARDYLEQEVEQDAIDEVREVAERDEDAARQIALMLDQTNRLGIGEAARRAARYDQFSPAMIEAMQREAARYDQFSAASIEAMQRELARQDPFGPASIEAMQREAARYDQFSRASIEAMQRELARQDLFGPASIEAMQRELEVMQRQAEILDQLKARQFELLASQLERKRTGFEQGEETETEGE